MQICSPNSDLFYVVEYFWTKDWKMKLIRIVDECWKNRQNGRKTEKKLKTLIFVLRKRQNNIVFDSLNTVNTASSFNQPVEPKLLGDDQFITPSLLCQPVLLTLFFNQLSCV